MERMASAATAVRDALVGNFLGNLVQLLIDFFFFLKTGWKKSPPTKIEEITRVTWSLRLGTLRKSHMLNPSDVQPPTTSRQTRAAIVRSQRRAMQLRSWNAALGPTLWFLGCGNFPQKALFGWEEIQWCFVTYMCTFRIEILHGQVGSWLVWECEETQLKNQGAHELTFNSRSCNFSIFSMWFWLCRCFVTAFFCQVMVQSDCARGQTWRGVIVQGFLTAEQWAITWHHHDEDDIQRISTGIIDWKISFPYSADSIRESQPTKNHPKLDFFKRFSQWFRPKQNTMVFIKKKYPTKKYLVCIQWKSVPWSHVKNPGFNNKNRMDSQESGHEVPERLQLAESLQWGWDWYVKRCRMWLLIVF